MKCIVETTGPFMLLNTDFSDIQAHRPSITVQSTFIDVRLNNKEIKMLARNLPRGACDVEFNKALQATKNKKGEPNIKLAVESYCAELGVSVEGEPLEKLEKTPVDKKAEAEAKAKAKAEAEAKAKAKAKAEAEAKAKAKAEAKAKAKAEAEAKAKAKAKANN